MKYRCLHDKEVIERFLREDVSLHLYGIGDLDDFLWPYTTWYGYEIDGNLAAIALMYVGLPLPTLLALSNEPQVMGDLLSAIRHLLPHRFYAHLSPGVATALNEVYHLESHGLYYKMALTNSTLASQQDGSAVTRLSMADRDPIEAFYTESYPGNWFDPRMLETKQYFGIMEDNRIVSIAGVHVYSPRYRVAALGDITTHPEYRNKGYGRRVTARLCQSLNDEGMAIGLNVKADNAAAIACYERIGFTIAASYEEFMIQRKQME